MIDWNVLRAANERINAFVDWDTRAQAASWSLAGRTVGVKSNIMVMGLPWTSGMELYRHRIAHRDAEVVTRLRDAGATVLGTVNMHEAALGAHTDNSFYGRTHNPHRLGYTPGGSSGGSGAAVAAGLCDIALGTDTMGSVRIPAAYCGVYGLKPTQGSVSDDGLGFLEPELDTIGPLAANLDVLEAAWCVLARDPGLPFAFTKVFTLGSRSHVTTQPDVQAAFEKALALIPLERGELALADQPTEIRRAGLAKASEWLIRDLGDRFRPDSPYLSGELKFILNAASGLPHRPDVLERTRLSLQQTLGRDGVLVMPTAPQVAFAHGSRPPSNQADFTCLANIAGLPALSFPAGWSADGLPIGVQLVGPAGSERTLIALARDLDSRLQAYRRPPNFLERAGD